MESRLKQKQMSTDSASIEQLNTLNHIAETLNRAVDVRSVLMDTLAHLVKLMGLETGWIFLKDPAAGDGRGGGGYVLAAHYNLPPALDVANADAWAGTCDCQERCNEECRTQAHNILQCGRLAGVQGDRRGLALHASAPLRSGDKILGILNVAGPDWSSFSAQALTLLTNVGNQIGVALERARLYDLLQDQRVQEQVGMVEFTNQLLGRPDLDDLLNYLVKEAREILHADACALLLPGNPPDCLDFRAASGWRSDPVSTNHQAPADDRSGPGLVMRTQTPLLVEDIRQSDPTSWLPEWLAVEGFRGHAVMPLVAGGHSVGALVVDKRQPRLLDEHEVRLLRLMANQAALAIEKARMHQQEIERQILGKELELAREIQLSLLPKALPEVAGWEFAAYYQPARQVGGDFYDLFEVPGEPQRLGMVIADVSGKGVPAALFMALSRTLIRTAALEGRRPPVALDRANEQILKENRSGQFVSVYYATLEIHSGRLVFANAGHNPPLWVKGTSGQVRELVAPGIVLGVLDEIDQDEGEIDMAPGDLLILYTDGVTESTDSSLEPFREERLQEVVGALAQASARQVIEAVVNAVKAHTGDVSPFDDITLLVVKRCPPGPTHESAGEP
jgi:serine phosphatase RsbU (regulator of sigma subunit)